MRIPALHGVIDRRILVNYRVNPDVLQAVLPPPFHPKLVRGVAIAGICLIRLRGIRPTFVPSWLGISSENAAHRMAVEWQDATGRHREGVYIPRRDTSSRLNSLAGGRLFPGVHHHARFTVHETADRFEIALRSDDDGMHLKVRANLVADDRRQMEPITNTGLLDCVGRVVDIWALRGIGSTRRAWWRATQSRFRAECANLYDARSLERPVQLSPAFFLCEVRD